MSSDEAIYPEIPETDPAAVDEAESAPERHPAFNAELPFEERIRLLIGTAADGQATEEVFRIVYTVFGEYVAAGEMLRREGFDLPSLPDTVMAALHTLRASRERELNLSSEFALLKRTVDQHEETLNVLQQQLNDFVREGREARDGLNQRIAAIAAGAPV
ncbi:MAG: hypothetical protein HOW73_47685 [Polyangiaceae bacterium]|nr:hypothetical protein [Polyangiaceae bacterium]